MASAAVAYSGPSSSTTTPSTPLSATFNHHSHNNHQHNIMISSEAEHVILPPPSALNPLPSLAAALRLDNRDQLLSLLQEPLELLLGNSNTGTNALTSTNTSTDTIKARQLLVFEDDALRTLLLRQVLNDPSWKTSSNNNNNSNNNNKQSKKNWETFNAFTYPKSLQGSIVGTKILRKSIARTGLEGDHHHHHHDIGGGSLFAGAASSTFAIDAGGAGGGATEISFKKKPPPRNPFDDDQSHPPHGDATAGTAARTATTTAAAALSAMEYLDKDLLGDSLTSIGQHVDVVTYFLRCQTTTTTQALAPRILKWIHPTSGTTSKSSSSLSNNNNNSKSSPQLHRLVYLPQMTALLQQVLQDSGLAGAAATTTLSSSPRIQIQSLQLDLFPIEQDVLSMEYPYALAEATLEGTPSTLIATCARTLLKIQDITGPIPRIQSLGTLGEDVLAKVCTDTVNEYLQGNSASAAGDDAMASNTAVASATTSTSTPKPIPSNHLALMVLDRQVDMVTPMVTPLTYEGLLDEVVGISTGFLQVPLSILNPDDEEDKNKTTTPTKLPQQSSSASPSPVVSLGVHAGDSLFAEVRDQHVEKFGSFLQNQAKALQESHANFTNKQTKKDLSEIHQFVKQIPMFTQNLRSLTNHIHLAEQIKAHTEHAKFREQWSNERSILEGESSALDVLEEWICSHDSIHKILRALCLQSICNGGLKASRYDQLRNMIVQGYGYEYLLKLHELEKLGWIKRKDTLWMDSASSAFSLLRKSLILIHAEVDTVEPDDIAYASSGYAPLTVRLIQAAVQGWTKTRRQEVLQPLQGRLVDFIPTFPPQELSSYIQQGNPKESLGDYAMQQVESSSSSSSTYKPTLVVFVVGGLSYMEIAALRFLSKRPTFPYRIVMITTQIVNGNVLLQQTNTTE